MGLLRAQSKAASFSNFIFIFSNSKSHPDRETYNSPLTTIFKISEFLKRVQFESSKGAFLAKFQIEAIF